VTIQSAEFDRGNKKAQKNVEVNVTVFDAEGNKIPVSLGSNHNQHFSLLNNTLYIVRDKSSKTIDRVETRCLVKMCT
jgi:hypothetical protein